MTTLNHSSPIETHISMLRKTRASKSRKQTLPELQLSSQISSSSFSVCCIIQRTNVPIVIYAENLGASTLTHSAKKNRNCNRNSQPAREREREIDHLNGSKLLLVLRSVTAMKPMQNRSERMELLLEKEREEEKNHK